MIYDAIQAGIPLERIYDITKIDMWFLKQYEELHILEEEISKTNIDKIDYDLLLEAKQKGWDLPEKIEEYAFFSYECKPLPPGELVLALKIPSKHANEKKSYKTNKFVEAKNNCPISGVLNCEYLLEATLL